MNFGTLSPSGFRLLAPPTFSNNNNNNKAPSGRNSKLNITDVLNPLNSNGAGLHHYRTPIIYGSTKNLALIEAFQSSESSNHGHGQSTRLYGSNEDIHQNHKNNNRTSLESTSGSFLTISKSRVPDIQMINKYYGLIPKKFTMHSRHFTTDRNHRNSKSKRSKSAVSLVPSKKSSLDEPSDKKYNEPLMKVEVKARRRGSAEMNSEMGDKLFNQNNVGLVTKKISVEKHKKKHRGGGDRSASLALLGTKGTQQNCHANDSNNFVESHKEAQRVIKIDLNNMSWEESYQSYSPSEELQSPYSSPKHYNNVSTNTNATNDLDIESSQYNTCGYESGESTAFEGSHNPNGSSLSSSTTSIDKGVDDGGDGGCRIETSNNNNNHEYRFTSEIQVEDESSSVLIAQMQNQTTLAISNNGNNGTNIEGSSSVVGTNTSGVVTKSVASAGGTSFRRGSLRKTISFDEQILRSNDTTSNIKLDTEVPKSRRPMTASTRYSSLSFNNLNPPTKVLPWTQRSGQGMSVAERRTKLQKSISIHSSEDSFDFGDGEGSDIEADCNGKTITSKISTIQPSPNSSAYKETRKGLFFQQPPEVPTMVSQISPIETLEIQVEIEKVALMLKNMQNQNKSFIDLTPAGTNFSRNLDKKDNESPKDTRDINGNPPSTSTTTGNNNPFTTIASTVDGNLAIILEDKALPKNNTLSSEIENMTNSPSSKEDTNSVDNLSTSIELNSTQQSTIAISTSLTDNNIDETLKSKNVVVCMEECTVNKPTMRSCAGDPISSKVQILPSPMKRPPFRKSVSISCEKELFATSGCQNEVNGNGTSSSTDSTNNENKGSRPKTAVVSTSKTLSRTLSTSSINSERTRSLVSNSNHHHLRNHNKTTNHRFSEKSKGSVVSVTSAPEGQQQKAIVEENNQSQALRNRKILIKKALIEINQSSAQLGKKWGVMGRPKTAPNPSAIIVSNSSSNNNNKKAVNITCGQNPKRQPLKASPPSLVKPGLTMTKGVIQNQAMDRKGETLSSSSPEQVEPETNESNLDANSGNRKTLHRQSFSLDEGLLLGFSNKEFGWTSSVDETNNTESVKGQTENSFQSSTKRVECLKIYEKMIKTGFAVKLDTIFRGMMTPSEYRAFIKAAENAAREVAAADEEAQEENQKLVDAGVKSISTEDKI